MTDMNEAIRALTRRRASGPDARAVPEDDAPASPGGDHGATGTTGTGPTGGDARTPDIDTNRGVRDGVAEAIRGRRGR